MIRGGSFFNPANVAITGGTLDGLTSVGLAATSGGTSDVLLVRRAAGALALRNGATAQTAAIYNSYTSDSAYEALLVGFDTGNTGIVQTAHAGGSQRDLVISGGNVHLRTAGGAFLSTGTTRMQVASTNITTSVPLTVLSGTAIPAGGSAGSGLRFSSTSNFGIFFGSGVPTLAAAQGSVYIRSDGSSTSTRMYVNTDGNTTWTAVTTAA